MPDSYTQVRNLFDTPEVLNANMVASLGSVGPFRLNYIEYSDGHREIDGHFFVAGGQTISQGETLITLANNDLFPSFTAGPTILNLAVINSAGGDVTELAGAVYDNATKNIIFRISATIASLTSVDPYYLRGVIVPNEIKALSPYLWGG